MLKNKKRTVLFFSLLLLSATPLTTMQVTYWQASGTYTTTVQPDSEDTATCNEHLLIIQTIFSRVSSWQSIVDDIANLGQARGAADFQHSQECCRMRQRFGGHSDQARWAQQDRDACYAGYNDLILQAKLRYQPLIIDSITELIESLSKLQRHLPQLAAISGSDGQTIRSQMRDFERYLLAEQQRIEDNLRSNKNSQFKLRGTDVCCPRAPREDIRNTFLFSLKIIQNKLHIHLERNEEVVTEGVFHAEGIMLATSQVQNAEAEKSAWEENIAYTKKYCDVVLWNRLSKPALKALWNLSCWATRKGVELAERGLVAGAAELRQCIGCRKQQTKARHSPPRFPLSPLGSAASTPTIADDKA